jgi:hypothetical protein
MSADTEPTAQTSAQDAERFVKIPRALPGQEYRAPKNVRNPLLSGIYRITVVLLCLSLPVAPAIIFFMILAFSKAIQFGLLWVWITMIIFIEVIAIAVAWGIAREALGISGVSYARPQR